MSACIRWHVGSFIEGAACANVFEENCCGHSLLDTWNRKQLLPLPTQGVSPSTHPSEDLIHPYLQSSSAVWPASSSTSDMAHLQVASSCFNRLIRRNHC